MQSPGLTLTGKPLSGWMMKNSKSVKLVTRDVGESEKVPQLALSPLDEKLSTEAAVDCLGHAVVEMVKVVNHISSQAQEARDKADGAYSRMNDIYNKWNLAQINKDRDLALTGEIERRVDQLESLFLENGIASDTGKSIKIKPCPHCYNLAKMECEMKVACADSPVMHRVLCPECGSSGPSYQDPRQSSVAWNSMCDALRRNKQ